MRILRSLLISQLLSALVLAAVTLFVLLSYTQQQIITTQQNARMTVEQILTHHLTGDAKILSRQLDRSFSLKSLRVSQLDGTILHEQSNSKQSAMIGTALLEMFGSEFKPQTLRNQDQNLQITFQLDLSEIGRAHV